MPKRKFIALCEHLPQLTAHTDYRANAPTITVTIAVTESENDHVTPRNWSGPHYDEPKNSVGGCYCWLYGTTTADKHVPGLRVPTVIFSYYGPDVKYGTTRHYQHGMRALRRVQKGMDARYREFGPAADAGASLDRWLTACGLRGKCVYVRPEGHPRDASGGWLNKGEWDVLTITEFVARVVAKFPTKVD